MTIASEITRLQWAKADIKTAIENKWVAVPANAKLDTYNTYINQIKWWWAVGIIWNKVIRCWTFVVGDYQTVWGMASQPVSYISWDYLFLLTSFNRRRNDGGEHQITMLTVWWPFWKDCMIWYDDFDVGSTDAVKFGWLRIRENWNEILVDACYWKYGSGSDWYINKTYWRRYGSFNKSTNTFWSWWGESVSPTATNPYFEWLIWDQWLYTCEMEKPKNNFWIQKFTPTFN